MAAPELIVIAGAPGSGKSTLMNALADRLGGVPRIEFSDLREWHLDPEWRRQGPEEEAVAYENLVFVLENYVSHGMVPVLVTDLREKRVDDLAEVFANRLVVLALVAATDDIRARVAARSEGFTNADAAVAWNERLRATSPKQCERRLDSSILSPESLVEHAVEAVASR